MKRGRIPAVKAWLLIALPALLFAMLPAAAAAIEPPPSLPANTGGTGLFDTPSARLMPDWNLRAGYSSVDPYGTIAITTTFLPWLEINGRFTIISSVQSPLIGYGVYKDKSIDFKLRLLEESDYLPAVAFGANDIHGTSLFASRYLVGSKLYGPFDLSLGLGQGMLAGERIEGGGTGQSGGGANPFPILTSRTTKTSAFGGLEFRITEDLSLAGEYSSIDYKKMFGIARPADSPFNYGLKYRWGKNLLSASWQRGDTFGWSYAAQLPLEPEGMLPWKPQPFWSPEAALKKKAAEASNAELAEILRDEVAAERFSNVRAAAADAAVWVEIENPTYLSNAKAMGRALRAICALVPSRIEWVYLSLKSKDIILLTIKVGRQDFEAYIDNRIDAASLLDFMSMDAEGNERRASFARTEPGATALTSSSTRGLDKLQYRVVPVWRTYLNDPSGFFKQSFSFLWGASYLPWPGAVLTGGVMTPLYNNISSSNKITEPEPVRTDAVRYLAKSDVRLEMLAYDQVFDLPAGCLARAEAGFFESAYGGLGLEVFRFFNEGRFGAGLEAEWVKKRDPDSDWRFADDSSLFNPAFVNLYYRLSPALGVDAGLKLGRFLAGDKGGSLTISRTFKYFTMGAWYTVTDTGIFREKFNRGYNDKGIFLTVPFSVFKDRDNPIRLNYALRPWTRDPGQMVNQINALYPMANKANIGTMQRQVEEMKQ